MIARQVLLEAPLAGGSWSDLIRRRCGLAVREAQMPVLVEALQSRMQALGVSGYAAYYRLLEAEDDAGAEWPELVDRLVSHESSFFRHPESFEAIRTKVLPDLRRRPDVGTGQLHLCSAGCSTGEEAYSLAMVGIVDPAVTGDFTVWGVDISRRALETARRARYADRAIASVPGLYRHFLRPVDGRRDQWEVVAGVRDCVRFVSINLFSASGVFVNYDLIVCQNVLIYFAPAAIPSVLSTLAARLTLGGYLLLGPGEAPTTCPPGVEAVNMKGVRAFRRIGRTLREVRA